MSLWDDKFVGWPDYERRPVRKREIEASYVDEFKSEPTPKQSFVAPTPEAIEVFGDIAITYYFWPEADQSSPTVYRVTHTWRKGPAGWRISGGMSCAVPRCQRQCYIYRYELDDFGSVSFVRDPREDKTGYVYMA
jgi:hypothetical protein